MSEPVNSEKIREILADFMSDIEEFEAETYGMITDEQYEELDKIYDRAVAKLDKEYFKK